MCSIWLTYLLSQLDNSDYNVANNTDFIRYLVDYTEVHTRKGFDTLTTGTISLDTYHGSTVSIICEKSVLNHTYREHKYDTLMHRIHSKCDR